MTTIKLKVLPRFPSSVTVSSPIVLSRVGGNYAFSFNQAASNASIILVSSLNTQSGALTLIIQPQGRLTLTTGVAITSSDVTAAATLFYTASQCPTSDGTNVVPNVSAQLSMVLDSTNHLAGKNFDIFKINDAGTMRIGTGPTWNSGAVAGSDTARGTGAGSTDLAFLGNTGILVNANSITIRYSSVATVAVAASQAVYLGTIRTTANGQTEDSLAKRFVWNAYGQTIRPMRISEATASWTYSTATIRQANANTANQIAFVTGFGGIQVDAELQATFSNSTSTIRSVDFAISLDSTSTFTQNNSLISIGTGFNGSMNRWRGFPGLGYHTLVWTEEGAGTADTQTWYGQQFSYLMGGILG